MKVLTAITFLSLGYLQCASALCNSGEVGIGRKQVYTWQGQINVLSSDEWVIAANDCGDIGLSEHEFKDDPCSGGPGYGNGNGISDCDGSGKPGFVWTGGGNFHNCYNVDQSCATGPFLYEPIYWCCQRW